MTGISNMEVYTNPDGTKVMVPESTLIGAKVVIGQNAKIGENCILGYNVYIGENAQVGNNCEISGQSHIDGRVGNECILYNVIIGLDGQVGNKCKIGNSSVIHQKTFVAGVKAEQGGQSRIDSRVGNECVLFKVSILPGAQIGDRCQFGYNQTYINQWEPADTRVVIGAGAQVGNDCQFGNWVAIKANALIEEGKVIWPRYEVD